MRFVPANCLRSDQILAKDIRFEKHLYMLRRGVKLSDSIIKRIKELGIQGAYITDKFSEDLVIDHPISDELRFAAKKEVKSLFVSLENRNRVKADATMDSIETIAAEIIEELSYNKNVMANMVDLRTFDNYTYSHCVNVAVLAALIGITMYLRKSQLKELVLGAMIHDIGKVFIDITLLNKIGKLSDEEFDEIKKHVDYGYEYLSNHQKISEGATAAVLTHHEQYSGSGYPSGLAGEDISLYGRIISVADVYDALTSDRPYRKGFLPAEALEYIMAGYDTKFDPQVVDIFSQRVSPYPVGTLVQLSSGDMAIVIENFPSSGLRPKVRLIRDNEPTDIELDLAHDRDTLNITIQQIVNA